MNLPMITVSAFGFDLPVCSDYDFWKNLKKLLHAVCLPWPSLICILSVYYFVGMAFFFPFMVFVSSSTTFCVASIPTNEFHYCNKAN